MMQSNNFTDLIKQGFRTAVGATASVIETLQDEQKRNQFLTEINTQWTEKSQEWAEKGEKTEQEARRVMEQVLQQKAPPGQSQSIRNNGVTNQTNQPSSSYSEDIRGLTQEIISLREDLKNINSSNN
jgi:polyhydroxyalkanoate synthesis regulator phasin